MILKAAARPCDHPVLPPLADRTSSVHAGERERCGQRSAAPALPVCAAGGRGEGGGPGELHLHRPEPTGSQISVHGRHRSPQGQTQEEAVSRRGWMTSAGSEISDWSPISA